jgi:uncharacterized membrane protein
VSTNEQPRVGEFSKARLEAFSDGVVAIAITLLVLELHTPVPVHDSLLRGLLHEWPSFTAYVVSFFAVGAFWINHHQFFLPIKRVDYGLVLWNLVLLLCVSLWPFTTKVLAEYLHTGEHLSGAAAIYIGGYFALGVSWAATYLHVQRAGLFDSEDSGDVVHLKRWRNYGGPIGYGSAMIVALFSPYAGLIIATAVLIYYFLPARLARTSGA